MRILLSLVLLLGPVLVLAQATADTLDKSSPGYRIGYNIGSWLPFLVIFILALMVILRARRLSRERE